MSEFKFPTKNEFDAWLKGRGKTPVGSHQCCPIRTYLTKRWPAFAPFHVGLGTYKAVVTKGEDVNLPKWAMQFIHLVDRRAAKLDPDSSNGWRRITGNIARRCLRRLY